VPSEDANVIQDRLKLMIEGNRYVEMGKKSKEMIDRGFTINDMAEGFIRAIDGPL
jgi:hypothetical protein